jgi:hypothetical protein
MKQSVLMLTVLFLLLTPALQAQSDTAIISRTLHYIRTDAFRAELQQYLTKESARTLPLLTNKKAAAKHRRQSTRFLSDWTGFNCVIADSQYYIPVKASRAVYVHDSLTFSSFDTLPYHSRPASCAHPVTLSPILLSPGIIEWRRYAAIRGKQQEQLQRLRLQYTKGAIKILKAGIGFLN